jgi:para-nitrobenzyl esterase
VIVETLVGKVEGVEKGGILQFRALPYAWADRFRPPEPALPWTGVLDATQFGPAAPQEPSPTDTLLGVRDLVTSEDCLTLNIYTPAADDRRRPVMVWIHGGGFTSGAGHMPYYNPTKLVAESDVVVVTINYRLGVLGFLYLDHLCSELAGSANNGIRDQIAALTWVRDNIDAFGGDPGRVTIFGESAGGMSVAALLGTPAAAGLFHGAIAQSGATEHVNDAETATFVTAAVLEHLEVDPGDVAQLLDLPLDEILSAQNAVETEMRSGRPRPDAPPTAGLHLPFRPVVDGGLLPRPPLDAVREGSAAGVPLVVGTTADEWNLFAVRDSLDDIGEERLRRRATHMLGAERGEEAIALYRAARPEAHNGALWCAILTDRVFRMPAIRLAEAHLPHAPHVAMYRFDYCSAVMEGRVGACHAVDIPFVFDNVEQRGVQMLLGGVDDETRALARQASAAWARMATTGRPGGDGLDWPAYDLDRRTTCVFDRRTTLVEDPEGAIRTFWSS